MNKKSNPRVMSEDRATEVAVFFSAFSDMSRVRILSVLMRGEMNVRSIAYAIRLSESAVSHHLRNLRQLRLVKSRKVGRQVFYSLDDEHIIAIFQSGLEHIEHSHSL